MLHIGLRREGRDALGSLFGFPNQIRIRFVESRLGNDFPFAREPRGEDGRLGRSDGGEQFGPLFVRKRPFAS